MIDISVIAKSPENSADHNAIFEPLEFFMLRAPLLSTKIYRQLLDIPADYEVGQREFEAKLLELARNPLIREAILTSSLSLLTAIDNWDQERDRRKRDQTLRSIAKYLIRMSTRPTPFGILSGVAIGLFGPATRLSLGPLNKYKKRTRPDMEWLMAIINSLEKRFDVVEQLRVHTNTAFLINGSRVELPYTTAWGQYHADGDASHEIVSVRATGAVLYALETAKSSIRFGDLVELMQNQYPETSLSTINDFLWQLFVKEFLLSELRPPLMMDSPFDYIIKKLRGINRVDYELDQMEEIRLLIEKYDSLQLGEGEELFRVIIDKMKSLHDKPNLLQVDMHISTNQAILNKNVADELAKAVECLWRLSPEHTSPPYLASYRTAFIEKYGAEREVPVLELLDYDMGLGPPASYQFPPSRRNKDVADTSRSQKNLDKFLTAEVLAAIMCGKKEIKITWDALEKIEPVKPDAGTMPISLELYCTVSASSAEAVDKGDYELIIGPSYSPGAGKTFGRFIGLLDADFLDLFYNINNLEKAFLKDSITAELVYMPRYGRYANVVISEDIRDYEIVIGTNSSKEPDRTIPLSDLVIGATDSCFYLKSRSLEKRVVITTGHMLTILGIPNICRFLREISMDGFRRLSYLELGTFANAPFLPQIRFEKTIIFPARWNLGWRSLKSHQSELPDCFASHLEHWRTEWDVPRFVYLAENDKWLLLDLENRICQEILRSELKRLSPEDNLLIFDAGPVFNQDWINGPSGNYICEFVVPFIKKSHEIPIDTSILDARPGVCSDASLDRARTRFPGSDWLYFKIYGNSKREEEFIGLALRDFCNQILSEHLAKKFFFLRYIDPDPHIRLRFNGDPATLVEKLLPLTHTWISHLSLDGLATRVTIDTYEREIERYGGPELIDLAEELFFVDSMIVADMIRLKRTGQLDIDFDVLAVISIMYLLEALGWDIDRQFAWIDGRVSRKTFHDEFRRLRRVLIKLGNCQSDWESFRNTTAGAQMSRLFSEHRALLRSFTIKMISLGNEGMLLNSESAIVGSMLHLHCNRLLGPNREEEKRIMCLARHTLYSLIQCRIKGMANELALA